MRKGDNKCPYPGCFSKELTLSLWLGVLLFRAITAENNITQNKAADLSTMLCCFQPLFNNVPRWNDKDGAHRCRKIVFDGIRTTKAVFATHNRNETWKKIAYTWIRESYRGWRMTETVEGEEQSESSKETRGWLNTRGQGRLTVEVSHAGFTPPVCV